MAILLREYIGDDNNIATSQDNKTSPLAFRESDTAAIAAPSPETLMVEVEGIHAAPFVTRNFTRYMPYCLKESQKKWTSPYLKPLIKHHNDRDGQIIGRIYDAQYTENTSIRDVGGLVFTLSVPDKQAAEEVENRILETVSIGVSADDVRCSICGSQITDAEEGCPEGHIRGNTYDEGLCSWDIYSMEPKELSYVIVPSDVYAKNKRAYRAKEMSRSQNTVNSMNEALDDNRKKRNNSGDKNLEMEELKKKLEKAEAEIKELKEKLAAAEEKNKELETLEAIKAEKEAQDKKLAEIQDLLTAKTGELDKAKADLEEEKNKLVISEEKINTVTQEKESAESAALTSKEELRTVAGKVLNQYRKMTGKTEFSEAELKKRSIDSIIDSVNDFVEDMKDSKISIEVQEKLKTDPVPNPVPPLNNNPKKTNKNDDYRAVDLSLGLEEMFSQATKKY